MSHVIKRNGKKVKFDEDKIINAIQKAFLEVDGEVTNVAHQKAKDIASYIKGLEKTLSVEEIQDIVEDKLMASARKDVARAYVRYRYKKEVLRKENTTDKSVFELLGGTSDYWNNENANKNAKSVTTQRDYLAGITSTDITRRFLLDKDIVEAHDNGIIHFHDADYFAQNVLHNCFSGKTKFITDLGVRSFDSFYDGAPVKVKDKDGVWRQATVRNYGKKQMYDVTLATPKTTKTITCTKDHRWILSNGGITTNLSIGDKLYALSDTASNYVPETLEEIRAFCLGFTLGDGCDYSNSDLGIQVRLCQHKTEYLEYFIKAGFNYYQVQNSEDIVVYNKSEYQKQTFLNSSGWRLMSLEQKIALFNGYYSADGRTNSHSISTVDERLMNMIEDISSLAGYYITSKFVETRDTEYKISSQITTYCFIINQKQNWLWTVKDIVPHYNKQYLDNRPGREGQFKICNTPINAWCVEEPVTHTFTLDGGIITGNCELVNLDDMLQNGTVVNGVMIEKPHRLITAATIATQIILAVTSSSYGGCTVSLTHLAPFVRDSYNRYVQKYLEAGGLGNDSESTEEIAHRLAKIDIKKEIADAVQTFNYQVNSMTNTNGQAPFLSVCMYLGETDEYKEELAMLIEEFLKQRMLGFKNEKGVYVTPAFPKLLYVLEEDNIHEDSKYYYLTELAAKCTAKRMVPDYISEKVMLENKIDAKGRGNCYPCINEACACC